jgi:2-C-methyl-D-erythritol 4-phosphate cytidylyltransferase/2-C-methyl-D-erythritol 2,4-cyclodiphosphate synthase
MNIDVTAIVPAAGRGTRYGAPRNKVLEPLLGRPILRWTLEALAASNEVSRIVIAVSECDRAAIEAVCSDIEVPVAFAQGGNERQDSVRNALALVDTPIVAVHDAARPLITPDIVAACIRSVREHGTGVAAIPVSDTLKRADCGIALETVDRAGLWATQTPQCCSTDDLLQAYEVARRASFSATDEAALLHNAGVPVHLVNASPINLKITTPDDLDLAEAILKRREGSNMPLPRIGYGYDVHRFQDGRRMVLGGVDFQMPYGLLGHSDADAVLHALMDALLGAAGQPDIGHLFPNTDERWHGASSLDLLAHVVSRITSAGYSVGNVDITVIAERPKIAPHIAEMKANIAGALGISEDAVGIKATTAEGLGDLGAGEGLAAHAVVLITK